MIGWPNGDRRLNENMGLDWMSLSQMTTYLCFNILQVFLATKCGKVR